VDGGNEHRTVGRGLGEENRTGEVKVHEVIAVEDRNGGLPYPWTDRALATSRTPVRRSEAQRGVATSRRNSHRYCYPLETVDVRAHSGAWARIALNLRDRM
jgi:hypothetical protein